jgi:hypothetical protein
VRFSADWLARGANSAPELAATVARISITIADVNVTEFKIGHEERLRPHMVMPAYVLAEGIVHRWWTLLGARGRSVQFRSFRQGFAIPDITVTPDAENTCIRANAFTYENPPASFINRSEESVSSVDLENELSQFIRDVVVQLEGQHIGESELTKYWRSIQTSAQNASERAFCLAAGALGCDPYAMRDEDAQLIEQAGGIFSDEQLGEFLSAVATSTGGTALNWILDEEKRLGARATLPTLDSVAKQVRCKINRVGQPYQIGYDAARKTRMALDRSPDIRFDSVAALARTFGSADFTVARQGAPGLRAVVDSSEQRAKILVSGGRAEQTKLFALARSLGDAIVFENTRRAAITDNETSRQAVGRAFAAELLAPAEIVVQHYKAGWTIEDIALECGVSDRVIQHQIENHLG